MNKENNIMENFEIVNYHKHDSSGSNVKQADTFISISAYCKRAIELGHKTISTCNHGTAGDILNIYEATKNHGYLYYDINDKSNYIIAERGEAEKILSKKDKNKELVYPNGKFEVVPLKFLYVNEIYFKCDPAMKKGYHLILIGKNRTGMRQCNKLNAEAVKQHNGFWNLDLITRLNPDNVAVTTACLASPIAEETYGEKVLMTLYEHFGDNLLLEVQPHTNSAQALHNGKMLDLADKLNLKLIAGLDSHYIYPKQAKIRDRILEIKGIKYEFEEGVMLDYPDTKIVIERFKTQGVLPEHRIIEALQNTMLFQETVGAEFNKDIKLPLNKIYPTKEEMLQDCVKICNEAFEEKIVKKKPKERHKEYFEAIKYEIDVFNQGDMLGYPLLCRHVVRLGEDGKVIINGKTIEIEKPFGMITKTGRGSGGSPLLHKLLGLTTLDRLDSEVPLLFERFISLERLKSRVLPDLDINLVDQDPFIRAAKAILGEENAYLMMKEEKLQDRSSIKIFCKEYELDQETATKLCDYYEAATDKHNPVNGDLMEHLFTYKEAPEQMVEQLGIHARILEDIFLSTKDISGSTIGVSQHACGLLLYDDDIEATLGLVRMKNGNICACTTGSAVDVFKFLKLDLLVAETWALIVGAWNGANIKVPDQEDLAKMFYSPQLHPAIMRLIEDGHLATVCQFNTKNGMQKAMAFKFETIGEASDLSAVMRPGSASIQDKFVNREQFAYGIPVLDDFLSRTCGCNQPFLVYQEQTMQLVQKAGLTAEESYIILKAISKKKEDKILKYKDMFIEGFSKYLAEVNQSTDIEKEKEVATYIWKIVEDSSAYSFNASHSYAYALDAAYALVAKATCRLDMTTEENKALRKLCIAYMKTALEANKNDQEQTKLLLEECKAFGITIKSPNVQRDSTKYTVDFENYTIYRALGGIDGIGEAAAETINNLSNIKFNSFMEILFYIKENKTAKLNITQIEKLIKIDYFNVFASIPACLNMLNTFNNDKELKYKVSTSKNEQLRIDKYNAMKDKLMNYERNLVVDDISKLTKIKYQLEILGSSYDTIPELEGHYITVSVTGDKQKLIEMYNIAEATIEEFKYDYIQARERPIEPLQLIVPLQLIKKPKKRRAYQLDNGKWVYENVPGEFWTFINKFDRKLI